MAGERTAEHGWKEETIKLVNVINPGRAWWQIWKPRRLDLILKMQVKGKVHITQAALLEAIE